MIDEAEAQLRNAELGAENLCRRCLRLVPGDHVLVASHDAPSIEPLVVKAADKCGARVREVRLERFVDEADAKIAGICAGLFEGLQASVVIASGALPPRLSVGLVRAAQAARSRHVHIPRITTAVLGSSGRADPELVAKINEQIEARLRRTLRLQLRSEAGTRLEVTLDPGRPIVLASGAPAPGRWENVPSGYVYFHPQSVEGRYVADRNALAPGLHLHGPTARRSPLVLDVRGGRLSGRECTDDATRAAFDSLVASDPLIERVGYVSIPTNYLVRTELDEPMHDALLPGARLCLGFSDAPSTHAPYDVAIGIRVCGRGQTVTIGGEAIVQKGRLADAIARGVDPFR